MYLSIAWWGGSQKVGHTSTIPDEHQGEYFQSATWERNRYALIWLEFCHSVGSQWPGETDCPIREVAKNGRCVHNILCVFAIDPFSRIQVWPLTQFFLFIHWKSLICLEGKSMTPQRGNTILFCSSQQLPLLRLGPLKSFLSCHIAIQRLSTRLVLKTHFFLLFKKLEGAI